ncbi:hypothetical protein C0R01_07035 [Streptomyces albidoflavus]|uniref:hypothetical protein n=1 Tax=Streptomyces albidoflavus TaxID=1886 RepID=UPI00101E7A40|nr:hypothetical protein [Streptomyces albidoflavus]RZE67358.1 hypothetical protein C0R00_07225 [Streptomyces albidoflavus]RZE82938.1 hypothetical protein C0R01_07035 [Streptomyces albidoflavus]
MTRPTLTDDEVQLAMNLVLREARETGRRATITAVERRLDVKHATFYRNFPHLITWFQEQADAQRNTPQQEQDTKRKKAPEDAIAELRRENAQLRRTLGIYAEALRQLTLDYAEVRSQAQQTAHVTDLVAHRSRRP